MLKIICDRCGREIDGSSGEEADADGIRVEVDAKEGQFIYIASGDDDGEPDDKHYCLQCIQFMLDDVAVPKERGKKPKSTEKPAAEKPEPAPEVEPDETAESGDVEKE